MQYVMPYDIYHIIPRNDYSNSNLDMVLMLDESKTYECNECTIRNTQYYCVQCNVPYCTECYDFIHKTARALKKHNLIKIKLKPIPTEKNNPQVCEKHKSICENFCKICQKLTCKDCIPINHSQHQHRVISLLDENKKYIKDLNEVIDIVKIEKKKYQTALKQKEVLIRKHEEYSLKAVGKVSQYFNKLHNILQSSERNTLLQIKQNDNEFKNKLIVIENKTKDTVKNLEDMIVSLQATSKEAKKLHLKKLVDSTKKFLEYSAVPPSFPDIAKNPFEVIENEDLEKLLKELCPYKVSKEIENPNKLKHTALKDFETLKNEAKMEENENALLSSINATANSNAWKYKLKQIHNISDDQITEHIKNSDIATKGAVSKTANHNKDSLLKVQKAKVSHFNNPSHFYVQLDSFLSNENTLNAECVKDAEVGETPNIIQIGNLYLIKTNSNVWERGKILEEIKSQTYRVILIDTGETVLAIKQQIVLMSKTLQSKKPGAEKCCIFAIKQKGSQNDWDDEAKILFKELLLKKTASLVILKKDEDVFHVDLISRDTYPTSFRSALLFSDIAESNDQAINDREFETNIKYYRNHKMKDLIPSLNRNFYPTNVTELAEIRIKPLNVISPSEFYVAQYESAAEMEALNLELTNFYNKNRMKIHYPRVNLKCAVELNGNWYRAKIIKVYEKFNVDVFLVDEGRSERVHYNQLSFLEASHSIINEYSFRCSLIDIEPSQSNNLYWTTDALTEFQRIMKHSNLKILIHAIRQKNHAVTLMVLQKQREMNVNALLVEYKYAISTGTESVDVTTFKTKLPGQTSEEKNKLKEKTSKNTTVDTMPIPLPVGTGSICFNQSVLNFVREEVIVTHIESPGEFYIQLEKFYDGSIKLHKFLQKYQEQILNDNPEYQIKYNWRINDNCLAFINLNKTAEKEWYRGIIIDIKESETLEKRNTLHTIYLRDYGKKIGNLCNSDLSPIRACDARICNATTKCHLACVKPTGGTDIWSKAATDQLRSYIDKYKKIFATVQGENINMSIPIILWGFSTEVSDALAPTTYKFVNINKTLQSQGFAQLVEKFDRDKQLMKLTDVTNQNELLDLDLIMKSVDLQIKQKESDEMKNINVTEQSENEFNDSDICGSVDNFTGWLPGTIDKTIFTAYPTYVDYNGYIYLHDALKDNLLEKIKKYLNNKFKNHINIDIKNIITDFQTGEPCIARYHGDSLYYRGEITSVSYSDEIIQVCFIDYGNVEECKSYEIIRKACLKEIPRQAVKYQLYGVEPNTSDGKWPRGTLDLMHILIVTKLCSITINTTADVDACVKKCSIKVDTLDLSEYLIEQNLARPTNLDLPINNEKETNNSLIFSKDLNEEEEFDSLFNNQNNETNKAKANIIEKDNNHDTKFQSDIRINKIDAENFIISSSDDENEIWLKKKKITQNTKKAEYMDAEAYKDIFQKEELNKFYTSVMSGSKSSDAVDVDFDCTFQSWNEKDNPFFDPYKDEESVVLLADEKNDDVSSIESFDPVDTSTVVPCFDGIENFKFYKLPYGLKEFYCEVHYIENLTKFFVSPTVSDLHKQYFDMMKRIQIFVKSSRSHLIEVEPKTPCLALFNEDGLYYRSIIKEIHPNLNKAEVLYVDYFNTDSVSVSNIRKCPSEFMNYPLRILPVQLRKIKPNPRWRESDIKSTLNEILNNKKIFAEVIKQGRVPEVQFYKSNKNRTSVLKELYDKKIFLQN